LAETNYLTERIALAESLPILSGDIVIFDDIMLDGDNIPYADCTDLGKRPHDYGELFWDNRGHGTEANYNLTAQKLYELLERNDFYPCKDMVKAADNFETPKEYSQELEQYKTELREFREKKFSNSNGKTGAIVMNCNPFTLGHRHLIQEASKHVDHLLIFVVEEDKSIFSFADRFELVEKGVGDLENVAVIKSGKFVLSALTFKEYFNKSEIQDIVIDASMDVNLFAKEIAPAAAITVRFAGNEPLDKITAQYNREMANILPKYGIEFIELPRYEIGGEVVSASRVRKLLKQGEWNGIAKLVPETTLEYLKNCSFLEELHVKTI
jgi:[citrate (pro-3S)-lyase] ligase